MECKFIAPCFLENVASGAALIQYGNCEYTIPISDEFLEVKSEYAFNESNQNTRELFINDLSEVICEIAKRKLSALTPEQLERVASLENLLLVRVTASDIQGEE